jgi:hypothetical protein
MPVRRRAAGVGARESGGPEREERASLGGCLAQELREAFACERRDVCGGAAHLNHQQLHTPSRLRARDRALTRCMVRRRLTPKFSRMRRRRNSALAPQLGAACRLQRNVRRSGCGAITYVPVRRCLASGSGFVWCSAAVESLLDSRTRDRLDRIGAAVELSSARLRNAACRRCPPGGVLLL